MVEDELLASCFMSMPFLLKKDKTFKVWLLENAKHTGRGAYEFSLTDSYL